MENQPDSPFFSFLKKYKIILFFVLAKLLIHLFSNTNYGFHRDEFLYLDKVGRWEWGYMEAPPIIGILANMAHWFGASLGVVRFLPTLAGMVILFLIGKAVIDLGGGKWAQSFARMGYLLSPAFLRSNMLFQPVTFDQFFWFLLALAIVYLIKTQEKKYWYAIGIISGLGFLTKYSISFYLLAFIIALLFSAQKKWLKTKYPYLAFGIGFLIALPNIYWQFNHNFPLSDHMEELRETQLVHVDMEGFLTAQLLMNLPVLIIWVSGLSALLFFQKWKPYQPIGLAFLFVIAIILCLSGKDYYTLGAYPVLFIFGGLALENWILKPIFRYGLSLFMILLSIVLLPYSLPILSIPKMETYFAWMKNNLGMKGPLTWEDDTIHTLPQDYADMNGWEEMVQRLSTYYHNLPEKEKATCMLYGGSYSHTTTVNYYRKKYNLPEMVSLHPTSINWAPDSFQFDRQLILDDVVNLKSNFFHNSVLLDSIRNPYAREKGYIIYRTEPKMNLDSVWQRRVLESKKRYNF